MAAREVVAAGSAFVPRGEELHDAGVALDWISDLRPTSEPVALRVEARGGTEGERELVQGDWLCDSDGSAPSRVPWFVWQGPRQLGPQRWHWIDAWETKMNGAFCVGRAARIDGFKDARSLALAAADCALLVKEHLPAVAELGDITGALEAWRSGGRFVMPHDALVRCSRAMPAYDEAQADPGSRRRRAACSSLFFAIASAGDWLCDGGAPPERLRKPRWFYSRESAAWSGEREWLEAWETCADAAWMIRAAAMVADDGRPVISAALACVADAGQRFGGHRVILSAIQSTLSSIREWCDGGGSAGLLVSAARLNRIAIGLDRGPDDDAVRAASLLARAALVYDSLESTSYPALSSSAVDAASAAYSGHSGAPPAESRLRMADVVRRRLPTLAVLGWVALRSSVSFSVRATEVGP